MVSSLSRRRMLQAIGGSIAIGPWGLNHANASVAKKEEWNSSIKKGLDYAAQTESRFGHWAGGNGQDPTAMTPLAGTAMICSGSTTVQGPFSANVRRATDYLLSKVRGNGLIGDKSDGHYTYGHGFSMLFLSQVFGEEEDEDRREELVEVLSQAVEFSVNAQTPSGGWGYVSAKDGSNFDEGSTTITQVQGLRGCRNAGIPVPKESIEKAKKYIYDCKNADGGISYSSRNRGSSRPAITAASLATLYNAGDYDSKHVPDMMKYARRELHSLNNSGFGHWHYTYLYYSQVIYRQGPDDWNDFRNKLYDRIVGQQNADGSWKDSSVGPIYATACNLIMLQLDRGLLPIYQR